MENIFKDYIKRETERMAMQAEMAMFKDENAEQTYILVKDEPDNIERFNKKMELYGGIPEYVTVFYNEPEYYDLIIDGYQTRYRIKKEKERQQALENPKVWQEVKDIETKEQLIEYLMDYWYTTNHANIWEYSSDLEVDDKELTVTAKELDKKIKEFLKYVRWSKNIYNSVYLYVLLVVLRSSLFIAYRYYANNKCSFSL